MRVWEIMTVVCYARNYCYASQSHIFIAGDIATVFQVEETLGIQRNFQIPIRELKKKCKTAHLRAQLNILSNENLCLALHTLN